MELTHLEPLSFFTKYFISPKKASSNEIACRVQSYAAFATKLLCVSFFVLHCALWFAPQPLSAQETSTSDITTSDITTGEITIDEINVVARELWCPLCSGVRLDVCELQACDQMREQIGIQLANDASVEEIKSYFIEQYGPQVMGEPPLSGFNWLAWIVPVVALAVGALLLLRSGRTMFTSVGSTEDDAAINFDIRADDNELDASPNHDNLLHSNRVDGQVDDQYADALDKELNSYE